MHKRGRKDDTLITQGGQVLASRIRATEQWCEAQEAECRGLIPSSKCCEWWVWI